MTVCQVCNEDGQDRRTLRLSFLYDIAEVSEKFTKTEDGLGQAYTILACKSCRGDFLDLLGTWADGLHAKVRATGEANPEANIPVRVNGRAVMMTRDQYESWRANQ